MVTCWPRGDVLARGDVLVFQHHPDEHPGRLGDLLAAAGRRLQVVELDRGHAIPDLERFGLLLVMGGPMDVWQEEEHPWLVGEKAAIAQWVGELRRPYLGVCLGHQLLADALGGEVRPMAEPEIGVTDVVRTVAGARDPVFSGLPPLLPGLQWHHAEVTRLPADAVVLATNEFAAVQALRVGPTAWGVQFHLEVDGSTVAKWAKVPEYEEVLDRSGPGGAGWLVGAVADRLDVMASAADALLCGLLDVCVSSPVRP